MEQLAGDVFISAARYLQLLQQALAADVQAVEEAAEVAQHGIGVLVVRITHRLQREVQFALGRAGDQFQLSAENTEKAFQQGYGIFHAGAGCCSQRQCCIGRGRKYPVNAQAKQGVFGDAYSLVPGVGAQALIDKTGGVALTVQQVGELRRAGQAQFVLT